MDMESVIAIFLGGCGATPDGLKRCVFKYPVELEQFIEGAFICTELLVIGLPVFSSSNNTDDIQFKSFLVR